MLFTAVAVAVGLALGLSTGGRFRHLEKRAFAGVGLLVVGVGLQLASGLLAEVSVTLVLSSYAALLLFAARNLRIVGMGVVLVGLAMNSVVIAVNGGMPVRRSAVVAAGIAERDELPEIRLKGKRHFEDADGDDRLMFLADIVPVPVLREVLSFGDLAMSVGVADVVAHLLRPARHPGPNADSRSR